MNLPEEFYVNPTSDQIEENIEFIDWSLMPIRFISNEIKEKFSFISNLKAKIWFEDLIPKLEIKVDEEKYPNQLHFFKENKCYMNYNKKNKNLFCSYPKLWAFIEEEFNFEPIEASFFVKNIMEQHFKELILTAMPATSKVYAIELYFKAKKHMSEIQKLEKPETFHYSNFWLSSSKSIVAETYEGTFKECTADQQEREILSEPFKIKLFFIENNHGRKLVRYELLEGNIPEDKIDELIKSLG